MRMIMLRRRIKRMMMLMLWKMMMRSRVRKMMMLRMMMVRRRKMMMLRVLMLRRRRADPKTGSHTLWEPAQSKWTWTFHGATLCQTYR
jgi:hypothetical protein